MFYLGLDKEQSAGGVNRIGWAVANSLLGPWTRVTVTAPLIGATQWWGAGQPSVTSIDGAGKVLLFYTRGDSKGTRTLRVPLDLSNANAPVIGAAKELTTEGLTTIGGAPDRVNHGGAFIYDPKRDIFWLIRAGHPFPTTCPSFISSQLQVATIPGPDVWSGKGRFTVHANLKGAMFSSTRVFDGGFAKGPYGNPVINNRIDLLASVSQSCVGNDFGSALWTYRTHGVTLTY